MSDDSLIAYIEKLEADLAAERENTAGWIKQAAKMEAERDNEFRENTRLAEGLNKASDKRDKLREALEFYADERTYQCPTVYMCGHSAGSRIESDSGKKALAVLAETGDGGE